MTALFLCLEASYAPLKNKSELYFMFFCDLVFQLYLILISRIKFCKFEILF